MESPHPFSTPAVESPPIHESPDFAALNGNLLGPVELLRLSGRVLSSAFVPVLFVVLLTGVSPDLIELSTPILKSAPDAEQAAFSALHVTMMLARVAFVLALAKITERVVLGQTVGTLHALGHGLRYLLTGILTRALMLTALAFLYFAFVFPGVIFTVYWIFTEITVSLRGRSGPDALRASKKLVEGRFLAVFWRVVALIVIVFGPVSACFLVAAIANETLVDSEVFMGAMRLMLNPLAALLLIGVTVLFLNTERVAQKRT